MKDLISKRWVKALIFAVAMGIGYMLYSVDGAQKLFDDVFDSEPAQVEVIDEE